MYGRKHNEDSIEQNRFLIGNVIIQLKQNKKEGSAHVHGMYTKENKTSNIVGTWLQRKCQMHPINPSQSNAPKKVFCHIAWLCLICGVLYFNLLRSIGWCREQLLTFCLVNIHQTCHFLYVRCGGSAMAILSRMWKGQGISCLLHLLARCLTGLVCGFH